MRAKEYDLLAIGGGTAGLVSTAGAAYLGGTSRVRRTVSGGGMMIVSGAGRIMRDGLCRTPSPLGLNATEARIPNLGVRNSEK